MLHTVDRPSPHHRSPAAAPGGAQNVSSAVFGVLSAESGLTGESPTKRPRTMPISEDTVDEDGEDMLGQVGFRQG